VAGVPLVLSGAAALALVLTLVLMAQLAQQAIHMARLVGASLTRLLIVAMAGLV
jgi:hypothetical protein